MTKLFVELNIMVPLNDDSEALDIVAKKLKEVRIGMRPKRRRRGRGVSQCSVEGCVGETKARGMCGIHYDDWYRQQPKDQDGKILTEDPQGEMQI